MITQRTDRATAETGSLGRQDKGLHNQRRVDRGVEEPFELAVFRCVAAQLPDPLEAARISAKYQKDRGTADPRHVRHKCGESIAAGALRDLDDRGLLEVRFRGGRECSSEQQTQQRLGDRALGIAPMSAPHQDLAEPGNLRNLWRKTRIITKAGAPFGFVARAHLFAMR